MKQTAKGEALQLHNLAGQDSQVQPEDVGQSVHKDILEQLSWQTHISEDTVPQYMDYIYSVDKYTPMHMLHIHMEDMQSFADREMVQIDDKLGFQHMSAHLEELPDRGFLGACAHKVGRGEADLAKPSCS